jgi:hypothetical protein
MEYDSSMKESQLKRNVPDNSSFRTIDGDNELPVDFQVSSLRASERWPDEILKVRRQNVCLKLSGHPPSSKISRFNNVLVLQHNSHISPSSYEIITPGPPVLGEST